MNCKQCNDVVYEPHVYRHELTEQRRNERETPFDIERVLDAGVFCSVTCLVKYLEPVARSDPRTGQEKEDDRSAESAARMTELFGLPDATER